MRDNKRDNKKNNEEGITKKMVMGGQVLPNWVPIFWSVLTRNLPHIGVYPIINNAIVDSYCANQLFSQIIESLNKFYGKIS